MATERIGVETCSGKNCEARILKAITTNGKSQPFDVEPNANGNTILVKRTEGQPLAMGLAKLPPDLKEKLKAQGVAFYVPHHATCPDVEQFK